MYLECEVLLFVYELNWMNKFIEFVHLYGCIGENEVLQKFIQFVCMHWTSQIQIKNCSLSFAEYYTQRKQCMRSVTFGKGTSARPKSARTK